MKKLFYIFSIYVLLLPLRLQAQGFSCNDLIGNGICTTTGVTFPGGVNQIDADITNPGNNYGCLFSAPNPAWYYLEVANSGNIDITLTNSAIVDVDFALWGPFASVAQAELLCDSYGAPIDCSFSISATEYINIAGATTGQVYVLLVSNYSNANTNINLAQTGGTGSTNCAILCPTIGFDVYPTGGLTPYAQPISVPCSTASVDLIAWDETQAGGYIAPSFDFVIQTDIWSDLENSLTVYQGAGTGGPVIGSFPMGTVPASTTWTLTGTFFTVGQTYTIEWCDDFPDGVFPWQLYNNNTGVQIQAGTFDHDATGIGCFTVTFTITGVTTQFSGTAVTNFNNGTGTFSPSAAGPGTYNVTYTYNDGTCSGTSTIPITVTNPYSANWNPPAALCDNAAPINLNTLLAGGTSTGGTWSGTGVSGNTFNPAGLGGQTVAVTYTVGGTAPCNASQTQNITVNTLPTAGASSNSAICVGATLNLQGSGGGTYSWAGPNGFTSTLQNPSINNVTTANGGTYSLTVSNNGCTNSTTTFVQINSVSGSASNSGSVCAGDNVTLNATGGGTYNWAGPNGFSSNAQNPLLTNVQAINVGTYTVTVTNNGCSDVYTTNVSLTPPPVAGASNTSPVCVGSSFSLNASGGGTYNWAGPNGFSSTLQNPTISNATLLNTGTYTVTVTNGCTATATTNVTINALPAVNPTSNSPVCPGGTIDLFANAPTATNIGWTGPSGFTFVGANPSIANASAANVGVYTVLVSDANGCTNTASTSVNISSNFGSASSNSPVCTGSTLTLSATGGTNYDWAGPNGFVATGQTPSILNVGTVAAGTYTVTITNGACTATATTTVTVNTSPTVSPSNSSPACVGDMVTLDASNTTGTITSYNWAGPSGYSSGGVSAVVNNIQVTQAGTYTVTVTDGNNCSATNTTNVIVNSLPSPTANSNSPLCVGNTLNLSASGGTSYNWAGPNGFVSNIANPSVNNVTLADAGVYTVTVTNANNCSSVATTNVSINTSLATNAASNSPVCSGDILSLSSVSGAAAYSWAGPNGFSSNAQNPAISNVQTAASGSYSVTVTSVGGCIGTSVINVVVNASPAAFASSNSPVCNGGTLNLSSASATTYNWAGPCISAANFNQQNPVINNASTACGGVYTVTVTNGSCSAVATTTVIIGGGNIADFTYAVLNFCQNGSNPSPLPLNGGTSGVYTGTAGLVVDPVTGIIDLATSTVGNHTVTNTVAGTNGCLPAIYTVNISISPAPNANFTYPQGTYCQTSATNPTPNVSGNYTYSAADPNDMLFIDPVTGVITLASSSPGIYQVTNTVAGNIGCPGATATQIIVIEAAPDAQFTFPAAVYCTSEPNVIPQHSTGSNGTYTYTVVTGGPTLAIDGGTGIINLAASDPGTYTILNTVNGTAACPAATFTQNITVVAAPDAEFSFGQSLFCLNGSTNPTVSHTTGTDGTYAYTVLSGGPNLGLNTATGAIDLSISDPGTYQITNSVAGTGACPNATFSQLVTINQGLDAEFDYNKHLFCGKIDAPIVLHTTGEDGIYSVTQVVSGGPSLLINQNTGAINLTLSNFGTYQITNTVLGSGGCPDDVHTVTITYADYPVASISPTSTIDICTNEIITLNGSGGAAYQWLQNNFPIANEVSANYVVTAPGNYSVVAYNTEGCADTTEYVIVARVNEPKASVAALGQTTFCQNASLDLQADGQGLYQWLYNGTPINGATASTYTATQAGSYQVILSNYCGSDTSAVVLTQVTAPPIPNFVWEPSVVFANETVAFVDSSRSAAFWDWNFGDNGSSTIQNPSHIYSTPGVYQVTMYIKDALGCDSIITKTLTVIEPGEPFIPNIFTPNGDNTQEEWAIDFKGYNNVSISVFDRWGQLVFETTDKTKNWEGNNLRGQKCPVGVYFYMVRAADAMGNYKEWKGNVSLMKN